MTKGAVKNLFELMPQDSVSREQLKLRAHMAAIKPDLTENHIQLNNCICVEIGSADKFAVPYENAIEIYRNIVIAPIANSLPSISGIINWRGKLITVVNLAKLFGIENSYAPAKGDFIIVSDDKIILALLVSEIIASKEYNSDELKPALPVKGAVKHEFITGIIDGVTSLLNMHAIYEEIQAEINQWRNI